MTVVTPFVMIKLKKTDLPPTSLIIGGVGFTVHPRNVSVITHFICIFIYTFWTLYIWDLSFMIANIFVVKIGFLLLLFFHSEKERV